MNDIVLEKRSMVQQLQALITKGLPVDDSVALRDVQETEAALLELRTRYRIQYGPWRAGGRVEGSDSIERRFPTSRRTPGSVSP